jgi:hypothetical protein
MSLFVSMFTSNSMFIFVFMQQEHEGELNHGCNMDVDMDMDMGTILNTDAQTRAWTIKDSHICKNSIEYPV